MAVKVGKNDIRYAMTTILDREMKKQQQAELKEMMDHLYEGSYSEYCKYCKAITTIDGKDENVKKIEVDKKTYLVGKCSHCEKELYVRLIMQPPKSMLDHPTPVGVFYTKEEVYKLPPEPEKTEQKPKIKGSVWRN